MSNLGPISNYIQTQATKMAQQITETTTAVGGERLGKIVSEIFKGIGNAFKEAPRVMSNQVTLARYGSAETAKKMNEIGEKSLDVLKETAEETTGKMNELAPSSTDTLRSRVKDFYDGVSDLFSESTQEVYPQYNLQIETGSGPIAKGGGSMVYKTIVSEEGSSETKPAVSIVSNDILGSKWAYDPAEVKSSIHTVTEFLGDRMPVVYDVSSIEIDGETHPHITMETLDKFPDELTQNRAIAVANNFIEIADRMKENEWVHGDLGHANIMCRDGSPSRLVLIDVDDLREISSYEHSDPEEILNEIAYYDVKTPSNNPPDFNKRLDVIRNRAKELLQKSELSEQETQEIKEMQTQFIEFIKEKEAFNAAGAIYCLCFNDSEVLYGPNGKALPQDPDVQWGGGPDLPKIKETIEGSTLPDGIKQYMLKGLGLMTE